MVTPFLDDWHEEKDVEEAFYGSEHEKLQYFYEELESKLAELRTDLLSSDFGDVRLSSEVLFDLLGQSTPLFSWQTQCPVCFDADDEDLLRQYTQKGDLCKAYVLRLSRLSRHLAGRNHWDLNSPARMELELSYLVGISLRVEADISTVLNELQLYDSLPEISQSDLLFRPDEINEQLFRGLRGQWDCLGRTSAQQAFDALTDYMEAGTDNFESPSSTVNHQDILGRSLLHMACIRDSPVRDFKVRSVMDIGPTDVCTLVLCSRRPL
jgi:hypothetical protein